jgi:hypothetical protein
MAIEPGYTVLPVSALKEQATVVFDALKKGKTVYVSKHGRIGAAFRPYTFVPAGVAALHASPYLNLSTLTARDMGRGVPSMAVTEAAQGLPSIVEKESRIYGLLTPAGAPKPRTIPDHEVIGAKAEAVNNYQNEHPEATIGQIMAFSNSLDAPYEDVASQRDWPLRGQVAAVQLDSDDTAVHHDIQQWRDEGSEIEDVVEKVFASLDEAIPAVAAGRGISVQFPTVPDLVIDALNISASPATRETVLGGEQFEAAGHTVLARTSYLVALTADEHPSVGVMWRLGNLARSAGHPAEAARWFRLSLTYDALEQNRFRDEDMSLEAFQSGPTVEAQ